MFFNFIILNHFKSLTLGLFYILLHGGGPILFTVRHMVKDHSDSERENPLLLLRGLLFPISSKGSFICTIPQTGQHILQPLLQHWWSTNFLREIAQWVHHEGSIRRPIAEFIVIM